MDANSTNSIITEEVLRKVFTESNMSTFDDDHGDEDSTRQLLIAKITAMLVLGIVSFTLGMLPRKLAQWFHWEFRDSETNSNNLVISLLLCFGGGVLMFTTFMHLQPEVREGFENLFEKGIIPELGHQFNLPELVFCIGFFFVYLIEEIVHSVLDRKHSHNEDEAVLHRTMSLRKCRPPATSQPEENPTLIPRVSITQDKPLDSNTNSTSSVSTINVYSILDSRLAQICYPKEKNSDSLEDKLYSKDHQKAHHHSHIIYEDDSNSSTSNQSVGNITKSFRGFLAILALSFHAIFEGLAVGLEMSVTNVWYLFLAVATHKFVISFCVGVELMSSKTKKFLAVFYLATFAIVSPLGIGIGIGISDTTATPWTMILSLALQGMAAGTLLYVVFFEVLQRERANSQSGILQLIAIMAGFGVMFAFQIIVGHDHSHGGDDHHDHHDHMESYNSSHFK